MSISTISFNNASRAQIARVQSDLRDVLAETGSGRHVDIGRTLGAKTGIAVSYRSQETSLDRMLQANTLTQQRLTLVEDTLETVAKTAGGLRDQLISGLNSDDFLRSARQVAGGALDQLVASLNLSVGGEHLFAGSQSDVKPIDFTGADVTAAAKADFGRYLAAIGRSEADVTPAELQSYFSAEGATVDGTLYSFDRVIDGFLPERAETQAGPTARISNGETIATSVEADHRAFRDLMAGYAMVDLASGTMTASARAVIADRSRALVGSGLDGVTGIRSDLGNRLARVESANVSTKHQKDILARHLASLEEVDLTEASTRVAALQTQLEASLRVTAMIREINILDYL